MIYLKKYIPCHVNWSPTARHGRCHGLNDLDHCSRAVHLIRYEECLLRGERNRGDMISALGIRPIAPCARGLHMTLQPHLLKVPQMGAKRSLLLRESVQARPKSPTFQGSPQPHG